MKTFWGIVDNLVMVGIALLWAWALVVFIEELLK